MLHYNAGPDRSRNQSCSHLVRASVWLPAMSLAAGLTFGTIVQEAHAAPTEAEPFKVANIHFETNASACDMGIQIKFDTEGITKGSIEDPNGHTIYRFQAAGAMRATGGQAEGFLEGIEPQIPELVSALGCEPSEEEGVMALDELLETWPAGDYTFEGQRQQEKSRSQVTLTHLIPAGPEVTAPAEGTVFPAAAVVIIDWEPVTEAILPELGPVTIVGYHVIVEAADGEVVPTLDVDLPSSETSVAVPPQFLKPSTVYRFEVLATEESGNQTISEGFFCTTGVAEADCVPPE
jgi:hypothetical protein